MQKVENSPIDGRFQTVLPQISRVLLAFYFLHEVHLTTQLHLALPPGRMCLPTNCSEDYPSAKTPPTRHDIQRQNQGTAGNTRIPFTHW